MLKNLWPFQHQMNLIHIESILFHLRCQFLWILISLFHKVKRIDIYRSQHCVRHGISLRWNVSDGNWMLLIISQWLTNYLAIAYVFITTKKKKEKKSAEFRIQWKNLIWLKNGCGYLLWHRTVVFIFGVENDVMHVIWYVWSKNIPNIHYFLHLSRVCSCSMFSGLFFLFAIVQHRVLAGMNCKR